MIDPFVESTETEEIRSLRSLRKATWVIFAFQLLFLLIFTVRAWEAIMLGAGLTIAMAIYALFFTGLILDILVKHVEQLNYRATEMKLILTIVLFCLPAICLIYLFFIGIYIP